MFAVLADGYEWEDADGNTEWEWGEASSLADLLESQGYDVTLTQTSAE
jgi:hypothetical protein